MKPLKPVAISGLGAISCVGRGAETLWTAATQSQSGIREGLGVVESSFITPVKKNYPLEIQKSSAALMACISIDEAVAHAGWSDVDQETALVIATTAGQISLWENQIPQYLNKQINEVEFADAIQHQTLGSIVESLANHYKIKGPTILVTSACSASAQAIALAAGLIRTGKCKRALVGGVEILSRLTVEGFRSLKLLSTDKATPFDIGRKGINLSEGAAFLALESSSTGLAFVRGHGMSSDAYHMTAPHPEGIGIQRAMSHALTLSGLQKTDIDWIHAHGTGSQANDAAESSAIKTLFGTQTPLVSSTKWLHGHMLGGSGALEAVLCVKALHEGRILPSLGLQSQDPQVTIRCATNADTVVPRVILKTTLGFGGNNAALIFSKEAQV